MQKEGLRSFNPTQEIEERHFLAITELHPLIENLCESLESIPNATPLILAIQEAMDDLTDRRPFNVNELRSKCQTFLENQTVPEVLQDRILSVVNRFGQITHTEKTLNQNFETPIVTLEKSATLIAERISGLTEATDYFSTNYIGEITWIFMGCDYEQGMEDGQLNKLESFIQLLQRYKKQLEIDAEEENMNVIRSLEKTIAMIKRYVNSMIEINKQLVALKNS